MTISTRIPPASSRGTRLRRRRFSSATVRILRLSAPMAYSYSEASSYVGCGRLKGNQITRSPDRQITRSSGSSAAEAGMLHLLARCVGRRGDALHPELEVVWVAGVLQRCLVRD